MKWFGWDLKPLTFNVGDRYELSVLEKFSSHEAREMHVAYIEWLLTHCDTEKLIKNIFISLNVWRGLGESQLWYVHKSSIFFMVLNVLMYTHLFCLSPRNNEMAYLCFSYIMLLMMSGSGTWRSTLKFLLSWMFTFFYEPIRASFSYFALLLACFWCCIKTVFAEFDEDQLSCLAFELNVSSLSWSWQSIIL